MDVCTFVYLLSVFSFFNQDCVCMNDGAIVQGEVIQQTRGHMEVEVKDSV